jgi:hypothetical protein
MHCHPPALGSRAILVSLPNLLHGLCTASFFLSRGWLQAGPPLHFGSSFKGSTSVHVQHTIIRKCTSDLHRTSLDISFDLDFWFDTSRSFNQRTNLPVTTHRATPAILRSNPFLIRIRCSPYLLFSRDSIQIGIPIDHRVTRCRLVAYGGNLPPSLPHLSRWSISQPHQFTRSCGLVVGQWPPRAPTKGRRATRRPHHHSQVPLILSPPRGQREGGLTIAHRISFGRGPLWLTGQQPSSPRALRAALRFFYLALHA